MPDNVTKQLIETVRNKVPLTGGLSIKGYPVMGTLSDMKNFKIEEGVLKLRYGTKTVASFDNKRFYFLKNFEFCGAEVLFGLDYQLCLHAFFENHEGYDFIVRDASQWHKNEMREDAYIIGKTPDNRFITSDAWTLGKLFKSGSQFWAYENQKYIMFFNDHGEIRVIVKDGGFKIHKDEKYIEVDIKDATNRVFDIPPALKADTRNVAPRITGEYRFARVNELGVISELTEPQYLQTWQSQLAIYGNVKMPNEITVKKTYHNTNEYDHKGYGIIFCVQWMKHYATTINNAENNEGEWSGRLGYAYSPLSIIKGSKPVVVIGEQFAEGCYLFSEVIPAEDSLFWLNVKTNDIYDIYDPSIEVKRFVFKRKADSGVRLPFYIYKNKNLKFSQVMFGEEQGCFPYQWFEDNGNTQQFGVNFLYTKVGDATPYVIHASNVSNLKDYKVTRYSPDETSDEMRNHSITILDAEESFMRNSKGEIFTFTWWNGTTEHQLVGEGKVFVIDEFGYKVENGQNIFQEFEAQKTEDTIPSGMSLYKLSHMDTLVKQSDIPQIEDLSGDIERDTSDFVYGSLQDKGRFVIWNGNKILGISQRLFVDKNNPYVPVYLDDNIDPENLLVRYSPVLSLEFMNQRSFRFELPLIRRAIRNPQFLCVSNNYVYEFEDNRLWYGSAYDFMLTGYTYLDGSLLKLIAYNEGVLACTTSGLYYVSKEVVQPVVNGRAIRADFAGETQVGGIVIAENKVYIVRTEITDSGARIETANLISEPINELVFNGEIKLTCNKRQLYLADDYNVYGFDTRAGIWNLRYNYGNKRIANIFILDNRLGILFDNEIDAAKANTEYSEPILPR